MLLKHLSIPALISNLFIKKEVEPLILKPQRPIVLANIGDDDTMRGDTRGRVGLSKMLAKKLGGVAHYADINTLAEKYGDPDNPSLNYNDLLKKHFDKKGTPDIVFGSYCDRVAKNAGRQYQPLTYNTVNEDLSFFKLDEDTLVSHHLTARQLRKAGKEFDQHYPDIHRPLITVFLASGWLDDKRMMAKKLTNIAAQYPKATIFICGGRRDDKEGYDYLISTISDKIQNDGLGDKINLFGWHREIGGYNPYMGLLQRSNHFIQYGASYSIVSEILFTGKQTHLFNADYHDLEKKGLAVKFSQYANDERLKTKKIPRVNIMNELTDKLCEEFKEYQNNIKQLAAYNLKQDVPEQWKDSLIQIKCDASRINKVPIDFMMDDRFLRTLSENVRECFEFIKYGQLRDDKQRERVFEHDPISRPRPW